MPTDLRPRQLRQAANKLRRGVDAEPERFLVDDLADAIPEGGFEALFLETTCQYRTRYELREQKDHNSLPARETDIIPEEMRRASQRRALEIVITAVICKR
jgi:hypothetical protein